MPLADQLFTGLGLAGFTDLCVFKEWQGLQSPGGEGRGGADFVPLDRGLTLAFEGHRPAFPRPSPSNGIADGFKGHSGKESGSQLAKVIL